MHEVFKLCVIKQKSQMSVKDKIENLYAIKHVIMKIEIYSIG